MSEVVCSFGWSAGGGFHQFLRHEGGAFGVDFCLEPVEEGGGVCFGKSGGDGWVLHGGGEELGGIEITEGVGGKVAESTHGPVNVL